MVWKATRSRPGAESRSRVGRTGAVTKFGVRSLNLFGCATSDSGPDPDQSNTPAEGHADGIGQHVGDLEVAAGVGLDEFDGDAHADEAERVPEARGRAAVEEGEPEHQRGVGGAVLELVRAGDVDRTRRV